MNNPDLIILSTGQKLKKIAYIDGELGPSTSYLDGFVYENDVLSYIIGDEGRIINNNGSYFQR